MSNFQQKEGQGSLFKNDKKTAENQPDYRGTVNVGGVNYTLAGWAKEAKNGSKFLSLKIQKEGENKPTQATTPANNDLPF
jgi:uncharacterized protein (DUF736 family)